MGVQKERPVMEQMIDFFIGDVQKIVPHTTKIEIKHIIEEMSRRSGVTEKVLLEELYEDLSCGIPFQYTAVGKSRMLCRLIEEHSVQDES